MPNGKEIALRCRISPGGFSGERIADVPLGEGGNRRVLAPRQYCWAPDGRPLRPEEPAPHTAMDGLIAARLLETIQGERAIVTTPDGEVFVVSKSIISPRPDPEPVSHVPV